MTARRPASPILLAASAVLALGALTACGAGAVDAGELETQVSSRLTDVTGNEPKVVECPDDLPAEDGAEGTCVLTAEDDAEYDVNLTVTSVEDDTVNFDIEVAEEPNS